MEYKNHIIAIVSTFTGAITTILGGYDSLLKAMLMLMLIDIVCGLVDAAFFNHSKYSSNGLSSTGLVKGAIRKCMLLAIVAVAVVIDNILNTTYIRNCAVIYFIATEGLSVLEHMVAMDVPFPSFVKDILEVMLEKADTGKDERNESN